MLEDPPAGRIVGRYVLYDEIASGGMATIHIGRLRGPVGFSRTVAIKRLHPHFAKDPEFVSMFLDEARLAARIRHPNVVATIDVVALGTELFLVMEYVQGESLSRLVRAAATAHHQIPPKISVSILADTLYGLHAAHEAKSERGEPLAIVHRDVSPHNILVGRDGMGRVLDFGVAKAADRAGTTRDGQVKGKLAYMAPEQLLRRPVDRRADVFAASVVLWEALTGKRLFAGEDVGAIVTMVLNQSIEAPSRIVSGVPAAVDAIVLRGLARDPKDRFASAREMAQALESALALARPAEVSGWVEHLAGDLLHQRAQRVAEIEGTPSETRDDAGLPPLESPRGATGRGLGAGSSTMLLRDPSAQGSEDAAPMGTAASQLTDLSSVTQSLARTGRRRVGVLAVGAAAVLALGVFATHRLGRTRSAASAEASPQTAAGPASGIPPVAASPASPSPPASPPPSGVVSASPPPRAAELLRPLPSSNNVSAPPYHPTRKLRRECDPPYFFDDQGVKRFKPQCV
jgi:serine/threonine protein kinase